MTVVTFGAKGRTLQELVACARNRGVKHVFDVRLMAGGGTRGEPWTSTVVAEALAPLGVTYDHVRQLACKTMPSMLMKGATPEFVDFNRGLRAMGARLSAGCFLLLGSEEDPMLDARGHIAERIQREMLGVTIHHDVLRVVATQGNLL